MLVAIGTSVEARLFAKMQALSQAQLTELIVDALQRADFCNAMAPARQGKSIRVLLPEPEANRLKQLAKANGLTLSSALFVLVHEVFATTSGLEAWHQLQLAEQYKCKREIIVPCGRIDLLSHTYLIEVKQAISWKHALGQVLAYRVYKPRPVVAIALFGTMARANIATCKKVCHAYAVQPWLLNYK